ncbi:MAG: transporter substrate-binding domain-containing protein [Propionibacterium sp.]|nr:transporter substrate-binding domain-containing protein [Propionibacterium sp.]
MTGTRRTPTAALLTVALVAAVTGCSTIPADSRGTLDRVRGGTLVVGVSPHDPWTTVEDDGGVSGTEVELVEGFAERLGADIEWRVDPESVLAHAVRNYEIDIMIGGLTAKSPWSSELALTRPYTEVVSDDGDRQKMVMGTVKGENAFLVELERHLTEEHGEL